MISLRELLEDMMKTEASDLHLTAGLPPMFRVDGALVASRFETLSPEDTKNGRPRGCLTSLMLPARKTGRREAAPQAQAQGEVP